MRRAFVSWLVLSTTACDSSDARFVAWPELGAETIAFVVTTLQGTRTFLGPYSASGPEEKLELEGADEVYLIALESQWLRERHPRVDPGAILETRLVERPSSCSACAGACRTASDRIIYHPIGDAGQAWVLETTGFERSDGSPLASLDVELPARWTCEERTTTAPLERIDRWSREIVPRELAALPDGRLLAIGEDIRVVDSAPLQMWSDETGTLVLRHAVNLGPDRFFVTAGMRADGEAPGSVLEFDVSRGELSLVRQVQLPFSPAGALAEAQGLVIVGSDGHIATSTDGVSFEVDRLPFGLGLSSIARVAGSSAPFILGGARGSIFRGDAWSKDSGWSMEYAAVTDSSVASLLVVEGDDQHPLDVWAKTVERGAYTQSGGAEEWSKLEVEVPTTWPACARATDECGFTRIGERLPRMRADGRRVISNVRTCPAILVAHREDGCASTVEIRDEAGFVDDTNGLILEPGGALVAIRDGVLRAPLDGL